MELINRRSAITALAKQMSDCTPYRNEIVKQCIGAVQKLKVHDPKKRKTGKWINEGQYAPYHGEDAFHCSLYGGHVIEWETQVYGMNPYCKWCGAKMEVGK